MTKKMTSKGEHGMWRKILGLLALMVLLTSTACGSQFIKDFETLKFDKDAEVVDTNDNREVLEVVDAYRIALEGRDFAAIKRMVSEEYYENGGTSATTDDDYGFRGLDSVLKRLEESVRSLRFEIVVKDVKVDGDRAYVTYEFVWNFLYEVGDKPKWESGRDLNRMHLVRDQGGLWKISRGL